MEQAIRNIAAALVVLVLWCFMMWKVGVAKRELKTAMWEAFIVVLGCTAFLDYPVKYLNWSLGFSIALCASIWIGLLALFLKRKYAIGDRPLGAPILFFGATTIVFIGAWFKSLTPEIVAVIERTIAFLL